ncbi:MAG: M20/M25/M40 family metallo-hydrolase [Isosphaeraceae bacterium]|nr:M20/M25/M40 family metallo-hydrolase [Isosphaeraceae bacterium]
MIRRIAFALSAALATAALGAQPGPNEPTAKDIAKASSKPEPKKDVPGPIERIREEGLKRSQVMPTLSRLTDVIGPRLTGSPALKRANEWTRDRMAEWGLKNAHLEPWGPFGRGWSLERFSAQVIEPQCIPLIALPKAWSPGLEGTLTAELVALEAKTDAELAKFKGQLKGKAVLYGPARDVAARFDPLATRLSDTELLELANAPEPGPARKRAVRTPGRNEQERFRNTLKFLIDEGAALVVEASTRGDGGTLFVAGASVPGGESPTFGADPARPRISGWSKDAPKTLPQVVVAKEHYNRMLRMLQQGERLKLAVELAVRFHDDDLTAYNTIAEIPGGDRKEELVMLGAHLDSWHGGTGATDNAAGVAVCMEAVRILQALKLQPRRTIRVGFWTGEEQGLLGSKAYVAEHFGKDAADRDAHSDKKAAHSAFSSYFNLDNGTGKVRGVYLQGNEAVRGVFRPWLAPFQDLGATTLTLANTGGTDHISFDAAGLPAFQFIQDVVEYSTRTHHSNQDVYDRAQADDLKQASVLMATFVYNTANRDEKLPRKPVAEPPSRSAGDKEGSK